MDRMARQNGSYQCRGSRGNSCPLCRGNNNARACNSLMRELQKIDFALYETILYLDAYPECAAALDYYKGIIKEYAKLAELYENTVGPIRQENIMADKWTWVDTPWPWQMTGGEG